jgi:hypothetical protein
MRRVHPRGAGLAGHMDRPRRPRPSLERARTRAVGCCHRSGLRHHGRTAARSCYPREHSQAAAGHRAAPGQPGEPGRWLSRLQALNPGPGCAARRWRPGREDRQPVTRGVICCCSSFLRRSSHMAGMKYLRSRQGGATGVWSGSIAWGEVRTGKPRRHRRPAHLRRQHPRNRHRLLPVRANPRTAGRRPIKLTAVCCSQARPGQRRSGGRIRTWLCS